MALLLPSLKKARENAKGVVCLMKLRQMGMLLHMYSDEYNNFLPYGYTGSADWSWTLRGYITGDASVTCASGNPVAAKMLLCPSATYAGMGLLNYSCHPVMMPSPTLTPPGQTTATMYRINGWSQPYLNNPSQWYFDEGLSDNNNLLASGSNTDGAWLGGQPS
jgi:hypothetical protein